MKNFNSILLILFYLFSFSSLSYADASLAGITLGENIESTTQDISKCISGVGNIRMPEQISEKYKLCRWHTKISNFGHNLEVIYLNNKASKISVFPYSSSSKENCILMHEFIKEKIKWTKSKEFPITGLYLYGNYSVPKK